MLKGVNHKYSVTQKPRPYLCWAFRFRFTFLKVARKFAPPANVPGKGPACGGGSWRGVNWS
jgi:hypothetical protein